jgi:hypothetical protein
MDIYREDTGVAIERHGPFCVSPCPYYDGYVTSREDTGWLLNAIDRFMYPRVPTYKYRDGYIL